MVGHSIAVHSHEHQAVMHLADVGTCRHKYGLENRYLCPQIST